jgi:hypothetical protein
MEWIRYHNPIYGTFVAGDRFAPPSRWWNRARSRWRKVVVFRVKGGVPFTGYQIGFKTDSGEMRVSATTIAFATFAMRVGHESCTFFAVKPFGTELELELVLETTLY